MAGRPSKYETHVEPRFLEIEKWLRDGLSEEQIAANLDVAYSTFRTYKGKYPALLAVLKKGRTAQVAEVENSLFKAATGYMYYEEQAHKIRDEDGFEKLEVVTVRKYKPPDVAAAIFFLTNKDPDNWANNVHMVRAKLKEIELREKEMLMRNF